MHLVRRMMKKSQVSESKFTNMAEAVEKLFPTTKSKVTEVTAMKPFKGSDGAEWHGITVKMANSDEVTVWNQSKEVLSQFKKDVELTYTKKSVTKGDKVTFKLADYAFPIPRAERFEPMLVPKVADAVTYAASYAKDMCVAEGDMTNFENYADRMFGWMKGRLLTETFE